MPVIGPPKQTSAVLQPAPSTDSNWLAKFDLALAFLTAWLWLFFILANISMGLGIAVVTQGGAHFEGFLYPAAGVILTGGFLGIIRAIQVGSRSIVAAVAATPPATADALRRAAKPREGHS